MKEREGVQLDPVPKTGWMTRLLDRAIYAADPAKGMKRMMLRRWAPRVKDYVESLSSGSSLSTPAPNRDNRWLRTGSHADVDYEQAGQEWREKCLELYRDNPIAHGMVEARVGQEIGKGVMPQANITEESGLDRERAKEANKKLEKLFKSWSAYGCDRTARKSFAQCQQVATRALAAEGGVLIHLSVDFNRRTKVPVVWDMISEARIETPPELAGGNGPDVRLGVQYSPTGEVEGYWVRKTHPDNTLVQSQALTKDDYDFIPRRDPATGLVRACYVFVQLFAEQTRGLPWLMTAANRIKDIDDLHEATIIREQVQACFTAFIKTARNTSPFDEATRAATGVETTANGSRRVEELRPGAIEYIGEEEEVTFANPSGTAFGYPDFMERNLRTLAAGGNIPYETIAKDFARTTFASGRLAMLDGQAGYQARRITFIDDCLIDTWKYFVYWAVLLGHLDEFGLRRVYLMDRELVEDHKWAGKGWEFIDPEREVKATRLGVEGEFPLFTRSDDLAKRGGNDFPEFMEELRAEKEAQVRQDIEIRKLRKQEEEAAGLAITEEMNMPQEQNGGGSNASPVGVNAEKDSDLQ